MNWVDRITDEQATRINDLAVRFRNEAREPRSVNRGEAEQAVIDLYRYVHLAPPKAFRWYPSPTAAFRDFESWSGQIGGVITQFWTYQLPLCTPKTYFHLQTSEADPPGTLDLAIERSPNPHGCLCHLRKLKDIDGRPILKTVLSEAWRLSDIVLGRCWMETIDEAIESKFAAEVDELDSALIREDPTSQDRPSDYIALGPFRWLVAEAACSRACQDILGARISPEHVRVTSAVVRSCGPVYGFTRLGVMCDRPRMIRDVPGGGLEIEFRDGTLLGTPTGDRPSG